MAGEFIDAPPPQPVATPTGQFIDAAAPKPSRTPPPAPVAAKPKVDPMADIPATGHGIHGQNFAPTQSNNTLANIFSLFNRPTAAAYNARYSGGNYFSNLLHGVDPDQANLDAAKAYQAAGIDEPHLHALGPLAGPASNVLQALSDVAVNPVNLLSLPFGGRTLAARLGEQVESHAFPAVVKAADAASASKLGQTPVGQKVAQTVAGAHDFLGVHSPAKRELARTAGPGWLDEYARLRAKNMQPPVDAAPAPAPKAGTPPAPPVTQLSGNWQPARPEQFGPAVSTGGGAFNDSRGSGLGGTYWKNPPIPKTVPKMTPDQTRAFLDAQVAKPTLPEPAAGPDPDQRILDLMNAKPKLPVTVAPGVNGPSDFMKGGLFWNPFGHGANVGALASIVDPGALSGALMRGTVDNAKNIAGKLTGGRIGGAETAEQIATRQAPATAGGAIGSHQTERVNPFGEMVSKLPIAGKVLGGLYDASGNTLWKFENEVRNQRFNNLVAGGMSPERAGLRVATELVDYEHPSPFAQTIAPVVPFKTWRTKAPLATMRGALENPARTQYMSSVLPGMFGGTQMDGEGQNYTSSLPQSELAGLLDGPAGAGKYVMGSGGPIPKVALDLLAAAAAGKKSPDAQKKARTLFTSGVEPGTYLANQAPLLGSALQYSSGGMFNRGETPSAMDDLLSLLRYHKTR